MLWWAWHQPMTHIHLLLLSKTCLLLWWKVYRPVGNSMLMMISNVFIYEQRVLSGKDFLLNTHIPFMIFLHHWNRDLFINFFLRETNNCFCSESIWSQYKCSDEIKTEKMKAWFVKSKANMMMWEHKSRHGLLRTFRILNSFLPHSLITVLHYTSAACTVWNGIMYAFFSFR